MLARHFAGSYQICALHGPEGQVQIENMDTYLLAKMPKAIYYILFCKV